ncbi:MAG: hypothetical protein Q9192_007268, partial [Flavoplaca navasiana]
GKFELGVAWEDAEEEFVDHRVFNIEGVGDGMFDGWLRNVFKGIDRGKLQAKGVTVALSEEDTLLGPEYGPRHAVAKDSVSEFTEIGGIKRGLLFREVDCSICCRHVGVDARTFGP